MRETLNQQVQTVFDRRALSYDGLDWVRDDQSLAGLVNLAEPRPTDVFLDVATGTGAVAERIGASVRLAVGVDLSWGMLRARRATPGFGVLGSADTLPFPDGTFDLITCRNGLHHFAKPGAGLAEMRRVAKTGGRIVISESLVPEGSIRHFWRTIMEIKDSGRHPDMYFNADELCGYLRGHGLPVDAIQISHQPFSLANWLDHGNIEAARQRRIRKLLDDLTAAAKRELHMHIRDGEIWLLRRTAAVCSLLPCSRPASA